MRLARGTVWILAFMLGACGYHVRQQASIPSEYRRMAVEVAGENDLKPVLISALMANGVEIQGDAKAAGALLQVTQNRVRRVVQSVGANNRVQEFRLEYDLAFRVLEPGTGEVIIPEQSVHLERDYVFDITQVIAAQQEERLLRANLLEDMAWQLIRRMEAQFRHIARGVDRNRPQPIAD